MGMTTGRKFRHDHAAQAGEGVVHVPERGAGLLGHADAVSGVAGRTLAVNRPAGEELLLHLEVELKAAAAEDDALFGLDEAGLARDLGPDAGDFPGRQLDQRLGGRFVHHFHVPLGRPARGGESTAWRRSLRRCSRCARRRRRGVRGARAGRCRADWPRMPSFWSQSLSFNISSARAWMHSLSVRP